MKREIPSRGDDALVRALRQVLDDPPSPLDASDNDHPDDLAVAAFLDGGLPPAEIRRMESHLAVCDACRELVTEARHASGPGRRQPAWVIPWPAFGDLVDSPATRLVALAATLAVAIGLTFLAGPLHDSSAPREAGDGFEAFMGDDEPVLRGDAAGGPRPLVPSFADVDTLRPDLVVELDHPATSGRLLLVDEAEAPVVFTEVELAPVDSGDDPETGPYRYLVTYPPSAPDLVRGALYAWKLDVRRDGIWVASPFTPFRVRADPESGSR